MSEKPELGVLNILGHIMGCSHIAITHENREWRPFFGAFDCF